jgi:hypothetical protein
LVVVVRLRLEQPVPKAKETAAESVQLSRAKLRGNTSNMIFFFLEIIPIVFALLLMSLLFGYIQRLLSLVQIFLVGGRCGRIFGRRGHGQIVIVMELLLVLLLAQKMGVETECQWVKPVGQKAHVKTKQNL